MDLRKAKKMSERERTEPRNPWAEVPTEEKKPKKPADDLPGQMSIEDWLETEGPEDDA